MRCSVEYQLKNEDIQSTFEFHDDFIDADTVITRFAEFLRPEVVFEFLSETFNGLDAELFKFQRWEDAMKDLKDLYDVETWSYALFT